jgi:hypothetical protein
VGAFPAIDSDWLVRALSAWLSLPVGSPKFVPISRRALRGHVVDVVFVVTASLRVSGYASSEALAAAIVRMLQDPALAAQLAAQWGTAVAVASVSPTVRTRAPTPVPSRSPTHQPGAGSGGSGSGSSAAAATGTKSAAVGDTAAATASLNVAIVAAVLAGACLVLGAVLLRWRMLRKGDAKRASSDAPGGDVASSNGKLRGAAPGSKVKARLLQRGQHAGDEKSIDSPDFIDLEGCDAVSNLSKVRVPGLNGPARPRGVGGVADSDVFNIPFDELILEAKPFARGGGGEVFRGDYGGNPVAAKHVYSTETSIRDFEQEVAVLAKLSHPCVMALYGVSTDPDGDTYMVMEYCGGGDLHHYYHTEAFTEAEFERVVVEMLSGVAYLHQRKIAHRDLKPANVLLEGSTRRVKIADFGLAKGNGHTATKGVGTPAYMVSAFSPCLPSWGLCDTPYDTDRKSVV